MRGRSVWWAMVRPWQTFSGVPPTSAHLLISP
jgi:hypothetical protein